MKPLPAEIGHKLTIAYHGTDFSGWQRQDNKRTVQECLEATLRTIWGRQLDLHGSGRTDAGVHATGQVASFVAPRLHAAHVVVRAMNANLPRDVRVLACRLVPATFHARFDAVEKTYRFLVFNRVVQDPFTLHTHWHIPHELDLARMRRAAKLLLGQHDFASFTSNPGYKRPRGTVRTLRRALTTRHGAEIVFRFTANGFLYRMVRNLVGGLVKVGMGRLAVDDFGRILRACSRGEAPPNAPAHGLYLASVRYPPLRARP